MDEILKEYNGFRFQNCIDIINQKLEEEDDLTRRFILQNSLNVCQCLCAINRYDVSKIDDMELALFDNYQNILAVRHPGSPVPLELELIALFNFLWWRIHCVHVFNENCDKDKYLPVINKGIKKVVGVCCKTSNSLNLTQDMLLCLQNIRNIGIKDSFTASLVCDLIILVILNCLQTDDTTIINETCLETVTLLIKDMDILCTGLSAVKDFENPPEIYKELLKFGFTTINSTLLNECLSVDNLYVVKCVCLFRLKKYEEILQVMRNNLKCTARSLWCYLGSLSCLMLNDLSQCSGFLIRANGQDFNNDLKSRFSIIDGIVLSNRGDYKNAIKSFKKAVELSPGIAAAHYYMGEEFGKIGLNDDMVECLRKVILVKEEEKLKKNKLFMDFEPVILGILHPENEITLGEAIYAGAVATGLSEMLQESAELFKKYFDVQEDRFDGDRIIKTPNLVTALHEAATVNIIIGKLSEAEFFLSRAAELYEKSDCSVTKPTKDVHISKDVNWINSLLEMDLGCEKKKEEKQESDNFFLFSEEMLHFFDEDLIGLILSAEMDERQGGEFYKSALGKVMTVFSVYFAQMNKREGTSNKTDDANCLLVKALSGKVCLRIARYRIKRKLNPVETERMLKRALSCNQGDKDVLYEYCKFLIDIGKFADAQKLWASFQDKDSVVSADDCQSLALRHLLRVCVTRRDLEKLKAELNVCIDDAIDFETF